MTTNKELGFYWVVYGCMNCGEEISLKVDFGKIIPHPVDQEEFEKIPPMFRDGYITFPECNICGCNERYNGKVRKI